MCELFFHDNWARLALPGASRAEHCILSGDYRQDVEWRTKSGVLEISNHSNVGMKERSARETSHESHGHDESRNEEAPHQTLAENSMANVRQDFSAVYTGSSCA